LTGTGLVKPAKAGRLVEAGVTVKRPIS